MISIVAICTVLGTEIVCGKPAVAAAVPVPEYECGNRYLDGNVMSSSVYPIVMFQPRPLPGTWGIGVPRSRPIRLDGIVVFYGNAVATLSSSQVRGGATLVTMIVVVMVLRAWRVLRVRMRAVE